MTDYELIIVGGGPAGMAAALAAHHNGIKNILIIERGKELGGVLNQCIHSGFGLHHFKEELTGPEYSNRFIQEVIKNRIAFITDTMVLKITSNHVVHAINSNDGYMKFNARAIILAMGCRERTRGAIRIHGSRPAGIYTAGTAQLLINIDGLLPGKEIVILGSGDIGLIMARRMTLEGAKVKAVLEILSHSSGLTSNIVRCLDDFNIPLMLSTTITKIHGNERVTGVTIATVDASLNPLATTEKFIPCDTVLLSCGLIPENELSRNYAIAIDPKTNGPVVGELRQTNRDGIFACGNVLHVHDLVDFVSEEGKLAGLGAAHFLKHELSPNATHTTLAGNGINYVVPQKINIKNIETKVNLYLRVKNIFENSVVNVYLNNKIIGSKKERKFFPAEMVTLELDKKHLTNSEGEIVVKVESLG